MAAKPKADTPESIQPESFEQAMAELEALVAKMDQPELGLDSLLSDYKRGAALVKYCRDRLNSAQKELESIDQSLLLPGDGQ